MTNVLSGVVVVNAEGIMVKSTLESSLSAQVILPSFFCQPFIKLFAAKLL